MGYRKKRQRYRSDSLKNQEAEGLRDRLGRGGVKNRTGKKSKWEKWKAFYESTLRSEASE